MTILQNDSGMVDADLGEMVGPDAERLTVRYGEGKVVQVLSCRFSRLSVELFGEPLLRPSVDSRSVREHNHNLCRTVSERDVSDARVLRKGNEPECCGIPAGACLDVCHQKLEMGEPGDRGTGYRLVDFCHVFFNIFTPRTLSTAFEGADYARFALSNRSGVEGAKRRRPATTPSSSRSPPPETTPLLLARRAVQQIWAESRWGSMGQRSRIRMSMGSKVPDFLPTFAPPIRKETGSCVDHLRQLRLDEGPQSIHCSWWLRLPLRCTDGSQPSVRDLGERANLEFDEFGAIGQGDWRGCHAHFTTPVAENDCGRFGMPRGAEVLVTSSHVGEEHTIGGHVGHDLSMPPAGGGRHRDP